MNRSEYMRAWRAANRERLREYNRAWRTARPGYYRAEQRAWTTANRERVNAQSRAWACRNKATVLVNVRLRQARQKAALCACCVPLSFKLIYQQARSLKMEVDHVQPLSKGGKHCLLNLQLLVQHDNRVKHAKWAQ